MKKIEFESEEQVKNFIYRCVSHTGECESLDIDQSVINAEKFGYIRKIDKNKEEQSDKVMHKIMHKKYEPSAQEGIDNLKNAFSPPKKQISREFAFELFYKSTDRLANNETHINGLVDRLDEKGYIEKSELEKSKIDYENRKRLHAEAGWEILPDIANYIIEQEKEIIRLKGK